MLVMDTLASLGGSKVISGPHLLRRPNGSPTTFFCSFHEKPKYLIIISDKTKIHIYFQNSVSAFPDMTYAISFEITVGLKILRKYTVRNGGSASLIYDFFGSISDFIVLFCVTLQNGETECNWVRFRRSKGQTLSCYLQNCAWGNERVSFFM